MKRRILILLLALVLTLGSLIVPAEAVAEEAATEKETAAYEEGETGTVTAKSGLRIRAEAGLRSEILTTAAFGSTVKVLGEKGKWSHVTYESRGRVYEGYCWTAYLSLPEEEDAEEVVWAYTGFSEDELSGIGLHNGLDWQFYDTAMYQANITAGNIYDWNDHCWKNPYAN